MGYHRAGFDVFGVDIQPQPRYPFPFHLGDALEVLGNATFMAGFDAIHASPPCQDHSALKSTSGVHGTGHLLEATLEALRAQSKPWVVENVIGAPMPGALQLCGTEFGLKVDTPTGTKYLRRHRLFLSNVFLMGAGGCCCNEYRGQIIGVYGHGGGEDRDKAKRAGQRGGFTGNADQSKAVMDMPWANKYGTSQAIPPAYTQFIGEQLLAVL